MTTLTINSFIEHLTDLTQSKTNITMVPEVSFSFHAHKVSKLSVNLMSRAEASPLISQILDVNRKKIRNSIENSITKDFHIQKDNFNDEDSLWHLYLQNNKDYHDLILEFLTQKGITPIFIETNIDEKINLLFNNFINNPSDLYIELFDIIFSQPTDYLLNTKLTYENVQLLHNINKPSHLINFFNFAFNNSDPRIEAQIIEDIESSKYDSVLPLINSSVKPLFSPVNIQKLNKLSSIINLNNHKVNFYELSSLVVTNKFPLITVENNDVSFKYDINLNNIHDTKNILSILNKISAFKSSFYRKIPVFLNKQEFNVFVILNLETKKPSLSILIHDKAPYSYVKFFKSLHTTQLNNFDDISFSQTLPELFSFINDCKFNIIDLTIKNIETAYQLFISQSAQKNSPQSKSKSVTEIITESSSFNFSISEIDFDKNKANIREKKLLSHLDNNDAIQQKVKQEHTKRKL